MNALAIICLWLVCSCFCGSVAGAICKYDSKGCQVAQTISGIIGCVACVACIGALLFATK